MKKWLHGFGDTCRILGDTAIYLANNDFTETARNVQADMDALSMWCTENGIQMNLGKIVVFGNFKRVKKLPHFEIMVNEVPLQRALQYFFCSRVHQSQSINHVHFSTLYYHCAKLDL